MVVVLFSRHVLHVDAVLPAITRDARTPRKTDTKDAMSLGTAQFCYVRSGIGWVLALLGASALILRDYSSSKEKCFLCNAFYGSRSS